MKFGITGHQERPGIDWVWVKETIHQEIARHSGPIEGLSSLAKGADQVFAEAILESGGSLVAVIPTDDYEIFFKGPDLIKYRRLLAQADKVQLSSSGDNEEDFLSAGIYITDHTDCLLAVWDGKPPKGKGGTADVVKRAIESGKQFVHINPFSREVSRAGTNQY